MRPAKEWSIDCARLVGLLTGAPESVTAEVEDAAPADDHMLGVAGTLDAAARTMLNEVAVAAGSRTAAGMTVADADGSLARAVESGRIGGVAADVRLQLAAELLLTRNKVTHIYELVKAYGSNPQVHYDRARHEWVRVDRIAAKHRLDMAVDPLSGRLVAGVEHAPLLYGRDPRLDVPHELRARLEQVLRDCDPAIVKGWLTSQIGLPPA
jgi:hypothetical protein